MRLFNKTIDRQLFKQYALGSDLSKQEVVVKIFNPVANGTWFILNSDPQDPDYLWAIVDLGYGAEVGSVSRSELENYKGRFGLGFERDLGFDSINAEELYQGLRQGNYYADGGGLESFGEKIKDDKGLFYWKSKEDGKIRISSGNGSVYFLEFNTLPEAEAYVKKVNAKTPNFFSSTYAKGGNIENFSDNQQMIMNQNVELEHHHEELEDILENKMPVPAWVVAKMETATQNLSDITHYLDGQKEIMEDQLEGDDDDDDDEMEMEEVENKEVVEPIVVTAGTKTDLTKKFTDDAFGNLKGFLKGMEGIDLREDYTFDYKDEQYEIEPIVNSDENGVSNAVFTIFDGDGEEVGEVTYSSEGGKQKFTANSELFVWNDAKFEDGGFMNNVYADGGYFDGAIPKTSSYMNTYTNGGEIAKAEIIGLRKNILGTTSIEMKISGMRKPQEFTVYPISSDDTDKIITIQSDTRIGRIDLKSGRGVMSQSHSSGAYFVHLQMDKLIPFTLTESDLEDLKAHIFKTAGSNVGSSVVKSDNSGASRIFNDGGQIPNWLFIGVYPNAYIFADKRIDNSGNYYEIGRIVFNPFQIRIFDKSAKYASVIEIINKEAKELEKQGYVEISATGQTTEIKKMSNGGSFMSDVYAKGGTLKKYILKSDIKTVTVKRKGKEVTYKGADVLNGDNVLAKGGDITSKANYIAKRDVIEVELKDGSKVKPANGYWIKKGAEPISNEPTPNPSAKTETKVGETYIRKDMRNNWKAETNVDDFNGYDWRISTIKTYSGKLISSAQGGKTEPTGTKGYEIFKYTMYEDPNYTLEVSTPKRLTEKLVSEQHDKALAKFKKFMETGTFKGGGKISNFDKLSAKVAKQYEGKPVKSQYQEEYGKYYSKEEAQEVGDKVAGKVKAMQPAKKEMGGETKKMSNGREMLIKANQLAKEIRKNGESWNDAKKRAFAQLKK